MNQSGSPNPPLRQLLIDAAREFNSRRYFETHEVLEDRLEDVPDELWDLVIGLIQIAVGYHKITQHLHRGATRMLTMGLEKVDRFPADAVELDLEALRQRVRADLDQLHVQQFDAGEFARQPPRMHFRGSGR